jgi:hypothetical protein
MRKLVKFYENGEDLIYRTAFAIGFWVFFTDLNTNNRPTISVFYALNFSFQRRHNLYEVADFGGLFQRLHL